MNEYNGEYIDKDTDKDINQDINIEENTEIAAYKTDCEEKDGRQDFTVIPEPFDYFRQKYSTDEGEEADTAPAPEIIREPEFIPDEMTTYDYSIETLNTKPLPGSEKAGSVKTGAKRKVLVAGLALLLGGTLFGSGYGIGNKLTNDRVSAAAEREMTELAENMGSQFEKRLSEFTAQVNSGSLGTVVNTASATETEVSMVSNIVKKTSSSVVSINSVIVVSDYFGRSYESSSKGSGIVFREDGDKIYIVTNYHVVNNAKSVTISVDDKNLVEANYVGGDENNDIAVISVKKSNLANAGVTGYTFAEFADSSAINVGDMVVAIGNAAGEGKSATFGIISAMEKSITIENQTLDVIQTDAAINPGNSGGALLNMNGKVVGISTAKLSETGFEGMGYAIPANKVVELINGILGKPSASTPYVGVELATITEEVRKAYNFATTGVYVNSVAASSPAAEGGLRQGDIITSVNGKATATADDVINTVGESRVGDKLSFGITRGVTVLSVEVTVGAKGLNF